MNTGRVTVAKKRKQEKLVSLETPKMTAFGEPEKKRKSAPRVL